MSDAAPLFALYEALWRGADVWAEEAIAFTPYDSYAVHKDAAAARAHLQARLTQAALADARFIPLAAWREGPVTIAAAKLILITRAADGARETRTMRLVLAGVQDETGAWKLVHAAEAMEAALIAMIAGYRAEAEARGP